MKPTVSIRLDIPEDVHALLKAKAAKLKVRFRDYLASILQKASK